jgi:hypothetical protein
MVVDYPHYFPRQSRAAIVRAVATAELSGWHDATSYAVAVFNEVAHELVKIVRSDMASWTADALQSEGELFLKQITEKSFAERCSDSDKEQGPLVFARRVRDEVAGWSGNAWRELHLVIRELADLQCQSTEKVTTLNRQFSDGSVEPGIEPSTGKRSMLRGGPPRTDLRRLRYELIDVFQTKYDLRTRADAAKSLGISKATLEGLVRDEPHKFSAPTKRRVLAKLAVSEDEWESLTQLAVRISALRS